MSRFSQQLKINHIDRERNGVIERWLNKLDSEDRKDFETAIHDPDIATISIFNAMKALGYQGGRTTLHRWRLDNCRH